MNARPTLAVNRIRTVRNDEAAARLAEELGDGVLRLSGARTPAGPYRKRGKVLACRAPAPLVAWVEEEADREHCTVNRLLIRILEERRDRGPSVPVDVRQWLLAQAASCGRPGDWEHGLAVTVRDLARTYPAGCRL